jgi:hypothetical protein
VDLLSVAAQATVASEDADWWSEHSTLIVGVVGIVVSGFVGPTLTALYTARRDRQRDSRSVIAARREDLRDVLDGAAGVLGGAVSKLRPILEAEQKGDAPPQEALDFLGTLFPLGQRLRLRLPEDAPAVQAYDEVRERLVAVSEAGRSQGDFDTAVEAFETSRSAFLSAAREALEAPIDDKAVR